MGWEGRCRRFPGRGGGRARGWWRWLAAYAAIAISIAGGLAGCTSDDQWAGGPVTPSPVAITFNPYALPRGDTAPTGILVEGFELVLYLWGSNQAGPALDYAWRDVESGTVGDHTAFPGHYVVAKTSAGAFFDLGQMSFNDSDLLIEFGAVRAVSGRITSSSDGDVTEARFTSWSEDASVTIFWLKRHGARIPDNIEVEPGRTEPLDEDRYPLITAYRAGGEVLAVGRLRPPAGQQKGG